jgi:hypothetical protein
VTDNLFNDVVDVLQIFWLPLMLVLGVIGNVLCILTTTGKTYRAFSGTVYVTALAVCDVCLLITVGIPSILSRELPERVDAEMTDITSLFFSLTLFNVSHWLLVMLTFDRLFTLRLRQHSFVKSWCTVPNAAITSAIILLIFAITSLLTIHRLDFKVRPRFENQSEAHIFNDHTWLRSLPEPDRSALVIFINLATFIIPTSIQLFAIFLLPSALRTGGSTKESIPDKGLSLMAISASIAFFLLCGPSAAVGILSMLFPSMWKNNHRSDSSELLYNIGSNLFQIVYLFLFLNLTIKFFLYVLVCPKFRREVGKVIFRRILPSAA